MKIKVTPENKQQNLRDETSNSRLNLNYNLPFDN